MRDLRLFLFSDRVYGDIPWERGLDVSMLLDFFNPPFGDPDWTGSYLSSFTSGASYF